MLLTSLLFLGTLAAPSDYVVLCGFGPKDPYYAAAQRIAAHHGTREILRFDPARPDSVLKKLRKLSPRYVAIVVHPDQIDVNTVRGFLKMATRVDDDPFVDFEFGYITGSTAADAARFVENIVRASKKKQPRKVGRVAVSGGRPRSWVAKSQLRLGKAAFPEFGLWCIAPDGKHGRDQEFLDEHMSELEGLGAIMMGGHGMPWEIGSGPHAEDVRKLELFPAVAFNYACHTGVTWRYPEWRFGGRNKVEFEDLGQKVSFALSMIEAGITGYVAYVNPRPAGPELTIDYHRVLTGSTLGEARRRDYDKIVLGYLGYGESRIAPPVVGDGKGIPRKEFDTVRHMMLDAATGGILYGDPASRPFPQVPDGLPLRTEVVRKQRELRATIEVESQWVGAWCNDPLRGSKAKKGYMAQKVYDRIELPDGFEPKSVTVASAERGGQELEVYEPLWAIEEDRGKRYAHVKVNFERGGTGAIEIEVVLAAGKAKR